MLAIYFAIHTLSLVYIVAPATSANRMLPNGKLPANKILVTFRCFRLLYFRANFNNFLYSLLPFVFFHIVAIYFFLCLFFNILLLT